MEIFTQAYSFLARPQRHKKTGFTKFYYIFQTERVLIYDRQFICFDKKIFTPTVHNPLNFNRIKYFLLEFK
jgi:hypothetical protein